jgi:hypothetical protein
MFLLVANDAMNKVSDAYCYHDLIKLTFHYS